MLVKYSSIKRYSKLHNSFLVYDFFYALSYLFMCACYYHGVYINTKDLITGSSDFFLGHYVPQLTELIYDRNKKVTRDSRINLKGFMVCTMQQ